MVARLFAQHFQAKYQVPVIVENKSGAGGSIGAGIVAKASATWVWNVERRAFHLTLSAQGGATFSAVVLALIMATLATERDPNHKLLIANYAAVAVRLQASIIEAWMCASETTRVSRSASACTTDRLAW